MIRVGIAHQSIFAIYTFLVGNAHPTTKISRGTTQFSCLQCLSPHVEKAERAVCIGCNYLPPILRVEGYS